MRPDLSPYEGIHDVPQPPCFGRVVSVDPVLRRCRVKTLGKPGVNDDKDLLNVQWLSASNDINGTEDSSLPTIGSYGVVIFVNSEPVIVGYYQPIQASGTGELPGKTPLISGDRVLKTVAGNSVILRSGGSVEIKSTDLCRMYFLPSRNLLNFVCQELEFSADGGLMNWETDQDSGATILKFLMFDNIQAKNAVRFQFGSTDSGALVNLAVGTYDKDVGDVKAPALMELKILPDGTTFLTVGDKNIAIKITPDGKIGIGVDGKELLKSITQTMTDLGKVQPISPLGLCAPLMATADWTTVMQDFQMITDITGDVSPP